jgi:hypothetical protein
MVATVGYVGFKQIRAIICAEPLHSQQSINRPVCQTNKSIWEPPRGTWASSRSGRSSVPSPCTASNPSIGLSAKPINQYGRHLGVGSLQADQGDHLCRSPAHQQSINWSVCQINQSIWAPARGIVGFTQIRAIICAETLHNNNPSIDLSAKLINQYGRHRGVCGLQADQGNHLCRAPAHQQSINRSVCHTNQSIWAPPRGSVVEP